MRGKELERVTRFDASTFLPHEGSKQPFKVIRPLALRLNHYAIVNHAIVNSSLDTRPCGTVISRGPLVVSLGVELRTDAKVKKAFVHTVCRLAVLDLDQNP
jgi:hypothetical protein